MLDNHSMHDETLPLFVLNNSMRKMLQGVLAIEDKLATTSQFDSLGMRAKVSRKCFQS